MPESPTSHQTRVLPERSARWRRAAGDDPVPDPERDKLAQAIPRRAQVSWWLALVLALGFAAIVTPTITAERWLWRFQPGTVVEKHAAPFTVRAPMLAGYDHLRVGGGVVVTRGELATHDEAAISDAIAGAMPRGPALYLALFALTFVLAAIFSHHMRRSNKGRLVRVQLVSLGVIALLAILAKAVMLATALSALVVPVAVLAMIPTLVLDRVVGIATGVLAALVVSLLAPFDVGLTILLLVQAATAGLVVAERPKRRWAPALSAGLVTTLCTGAMYLLLTYLTTGHAPEPRDPLHAAWLAALIGPALAAVLAVPLLPLYQLVVGEITQGQLFALEDLGHPLLRQIAERSPGTWQHSLMMANMAEIAANAIGASGRLVRVGAYFHDLGKSLSPKYFIENLEAGETSPHDQLPPELSCDAIFAHVSGGITAARKAGLHDRIVDFMHMHHGNAVLEYFWTKCREQGNPHGYTVEQFRYPGHPPQSRETAILTICDAVEAASRTLHKPDAALIESLVQRIVYGKLHLGQLDESGLSMGDLRRISDSLRETIRHANHGRIEYPWQKAEQAASASAPGVTSTAPRLDSLDRKPARDSGTPQVRTASVGDSNDALAATADVQDAPAGDSDAVRIRAGSARNASSGRNASDRAEPSREADTVALGRAGDRLGPVVEPGPSLDAARGDHRGVRRRSDGLVRDDADEPPAITLVREDHAEHAPTELLLDDTGRAQRASHESARTQAPHASREPGSPPPELITPDTFHDPSNDPSNDPSPAARKRAATLPPMQLRRPTTAPPAIATRRTDLARTAGPPEPVDLENATTNPPPLRRTPSGQPAVPQDPGQLAAALAAIVSRVSSAPFGSPQPAAPSTDDAAVSQPALAGPTPAQPRLADTLGSDARVTATHDVDAADRFASSFDPKLDPLPDEAPYSGIDAGVTEPSMPVLEIGDQRRVDVPLRSVARTVPTSSPPHRKPRWSSGLAARIDAAFDSDDWGRETPVVAPTRAELRALTGHPDPTRQVPLDELEILQRRAAELAEAESPRRAPHPTSEVDPDDIEAAIELAPPARRPTHANAIGAKPKKSE